MSLDIVMTHPHSHLSFLPSFLPFFLSRVLNVIKIWVDKHFDDFLADRALLTKLLEFVDKGMTNIPTMARAADSLKAQIVIKLQAGSEPVGPKEYQFDTQPPKPITPPDNLQTLTLLDLNPLEVARQFTLMDFELFSTIKPLEYLYFTKPSSWSMTFEEQEDEDPANVKNAPHIVATIYRFSDVSSFNRILQLIARS